MNPKLDSLLRNTLFLYSKTRSTNFALQYWVLNKISSTMGFKTPIPYQDIDLVAGIQEELDRLLKSDIDRIRRGYYPIGVLKPDHPIETLRLFPKVILDVFKVGKQRTTGRSSAFTRAAREYLDELPRYYQRKFHHQTDGYLSEKSAEVYDYQVELLFSGAADAMRRLLIAPIKDHFNLTKDGKGLRLLEIGAGTGSATRFMKLAFPKARIVAIDLSDPYLKVAQRKLSPFPRVDFLQADGSRLPFKDEEFDAAYSVFMFHEMPRDTRLAVLKESYRVLKKGGFLGFVDSIQKGDSPKLDLFLDEFPKNFHEPFYINYIHSPMEELFRSLCDSEYHSQVGLFSKIGFMVKK